MIEIATAATLAGIILGFILGYWCRPFLSRFPNTKSVESQEFSAFMERIVNAEGAEERRNQMRKMLHDAGRRTMRLDGGPPATVHKMRRSKRRTIHPD